MFQLIWTEQIDKKKFIGNSFIEKKDAKIIEKGNVTSKKRGINLIFKIHKFSRI